MHIKSAIVFALVALSACIVTQPVQAPATSVSPPPMAQAADDCQCTPDVQLRLRRHLAAAGLPTSMASDRVVHCAFDDQQGCTNEAVVGFNAQTQRCVAVLSYCVLCVHTRNRQDRSEPFTPTLRWNLVERTGGPRTKRFVFENLKGIDIPKAVSTSGNSKWHFRFPQIDVTDGTIFYWTVGRDKSPPLAHTSNIQPADTSSDAKCEPYDPLIVNTDN